MLGNFSIQDGDGDTEETSLMPPSGPRKSIDISVLAATYRTRYRNMARRRSFCARVRALLGRVWDYIDRRWLTFLYLHALYFCVLALAGATVIYLIERNRTGLRVCPHSPHSLTLSVLLACFCNQSRFSPGWPGRRWDSSLTRCSTACRR